MAVGNIKGIIVEIGADTGPLDKALKGVNATSRDLQTELKAVNTGLKFDPTNTVLLEQKQKLLADAVQGTKDKLLILKTAQEQFVASGKDLNDENYRALQREIVTTEQKLKGLETQATKAAGALTSDQAVGNLKKIGLAAGAAAVAAGAAFVAMGVAELENADKIQVTADIYGLTAERVQELQYVGTKLDVELDTMTKAQSLLTKNMYLAEKGTGTQADAFKALGVSVVDGNGNLRDAKTVMDETITALGKMPNETERDAVAMKLFGKSAMELNPLIKAGGEEIAKLTKEARDSGAVLSNEGIAGLDGFGDSVEALKVSVMGLVGQALANILPQLQGMLTNLMAIPAWIEKNSTLLTVIGIVLGTFIAAIIAYNVAAAWGAITTGVMTTATYAFEAALAFAQTSMVVWILAIGAVIAIGVLLYKNWDTVSAFLTATWTAISQKATEIFNVIAAFFVNTWNGITSTVTSVWTGIVNFFTTTWASISATITTVWNGIKDFFSVVWNGIVTVVMAIINPFVQGILTLWNSMKAGITGIMDGVKSALSGIWDAIKNVVLGVVLLLIDLVTGNFTKLKTDVEGIFNNLKAAFSQIWDGIKLIFTGTVDAIVGFLKVAWDGIKNTAETIWNGIKTFFETTWTGITTTVTNAWDGIIDFFNGAWSRLTAAITGGFDAAITFITELPWRAYQWGSDIINGIVNGVNVVAWSVGSAVSSGFDTAIGFITNLPWQAWQWGVDIINGIVQGIKDAAWAVGNAVSGVAQTIRNFLHFSVPDQGPLVDFESWMPDFMGGLADGITNSKWMVSDAIKGLSTDMSIGVSARMTSGTTSDSTKIGNEKPTQIIIENHNTTTLDGKVVARSTSRRQANTNDALARALGVPA